MNVITKPFSQRSEIAQTAIVLGGATVIIVGVVKFKKYQENKRLKQAQENYNKLVGTEKDTFAAAGEKLSYPPSNYKTYADQLEKAMQYTGTYSNVIYDIFKLMKNNLDIIALVQAFGTREIYFWGFTYKFTLPEAIRDELDATDIAKINKLFASKKIKYRF